MSLARPTSESAADTPQPSARRRGFWARHRATLLTIALVLYTMVLCVGIGDDVLDLGLFPTRLERQARQFIARFDGPDEADRRAAVDELIREVEPFVAIPELIRALGSRSAGTREMAAKGLRRLAKTSQNYDPAASREEHRAAIARWRNWWKESKHRY